MMKPKLALGIFLGATLVACGGGRETAFRDAAAPNNPHAPSSAEARPSLPAPIAGLRSD